MSTKLQVAIDEAIRKLTDLRAHSPIVSKASIGVDSAGDITDLRDLLLSAARAVDLIPQTIAYEAGLTSMSGASAYAGIFTGSVDGFLEHELATIVENVTTDDDRPSYNPQSDLGTLNRFQQGARA